MEKYGVETEKVKHAKEGEEGKCPWCGTELDENGHCPIHGSAPFEPNAKPPEEK